MKRYLLMLSLLAIALVSCTKEVSPEISASVFSQQTDSKGCEFSVNIKSNAPWTAESNYSEVTVTPSSGIGNGQATIKVPQYLGRATKLVTVTFTAHSDTLSTNKAIVAITQQSLPFLYCDKNVKTVSASETLAVFDVNSNFSWECKEIKFTGERFDLQMDPTGWSYNKVPVCFTFPANTTGAERRADVILSLIEYPQVTDTLTIIQQK